MDKQTGILLKLQIVHVVGGRIPVLFDGGVRRGTDVFKALALGAQAVLVSFECFGFGIWHTLFSVDVMTLFGWMMQVGRPIVYGLAANGEDGVRKVIDMLKNEFEITMALSGCPTINDITRSHVKTKDERLHSML